MANRAIPSPLPISPEKNLPPSEVVGTANVAPDVPQPDAAAIPLEARLGELADEILLLAEGDGVAIALAENGEMRCQASGGTIAPPLGARIDARSGLTGACLRSGSLLRCDDTENDARVDRDVCRALGIRSIICVPVCVAQEVIGIFEIFSSRPKAFASLDGVALRGKAEQIANCCLEPEVSEPAIAPAEEPHLGGADELPAAYTPPAQRLARHLPVIPISQKTWQALLGVLVLALGLFLLLRAIRGPQTQIATAAAPQPVAAEPVSVAVPAPAAPAPKVEQRRVEARPLIESRRAPSPQPKQNVIAVAADTPGKPVSAPEPPPTEALFAQGGDSVAVSQLVGSLPATAPELAKAIRVSTGVAKPVLLHRVEPIYPAMAKQGGIEGSVVLDATVNKSGRVDNLQVISGNSLLVAAAVQAVRQWRYRPYRLNDQVIEVPVRITLNFKLGR